MPHHDRMTRHECTKMQPFPSKEQIGKDFQKIRNEEDISSVLRYFLCNHQNHSDDRDESESLCLKRQLQDRLAELRRAFMNSKFFSTHEIIGSSLLLIHDGTKLGVWMIDFAKSVPLPEGTTIDHLSPWKLGNHEDGYLYGLNNLIRLVDSL